MVRNMKSLATISLAMWLGSGCARLDIPRTRPDPPRPAPRGTLRRQGRAHRMVVVGPAWFHAYSASAGGTLYLVPAVSGNTDDCVSISAEAPLRATRIQPDRAFRLVVAAGQVACLATARAGTFELL